MSKFWQDHPVVWSQVTLLENFLTQDNRCFQKSDFQWEISCFFVFVSISIGLLCFPTTNSKCWAQFSWTMDITIWKKMEENMKELNDEFLFTRILTIMFLIFWRSLWKVSSTWFLKQLITIMKLLLQGLSVECGMSTGCLKIYKKVRTNFGRRDYLSNCLFRVSKINSRRQRSTTTESSFQPTEGDLTLTCLGVNFINHRKW